MDLLDELKKRARALHKAATNRDEPALERLGRHPELKSLSRDELLAQLKRRHCLAILAIEAGFSG